MSTPVSNRISFSAAPVRRDARLWEHDHVRRKVRPSLTTIQLGPHYQQRHGQHPFCNINVIHYVALMSNELPNLWTNSPTKICDDSLFFQFWSNVLEKAISFSFPIEVSYRDKFTDLKFNTLSLLHLTRDIWTDVGSTCLVSTRGSRTCWRRS